jgi:RNA polymerase sigma-70 factor (ECF subfamily)
VSSSSQPVGSPDHERILVVRAQAGDRAAANELLELLYDQLWRVARRMLGNDSDAYDATQDTLIKIVTGLHTFDGNSQVRTWAYRIAQNTCIDALRKRQRTPEPVDTQAELAHSAQWNSSRHGEVELRLDLDRAMDQLLPEVRSVIVLRSVMDLDYETIAEILDLPIGTVRSRLSRGRSQLTELLDGGNQTNDTNVQREDS